MPSRRKLIIEALTPVVTFRHGPGHGILSFLADTFLEMEYYSLKAQLD